MLLNAALQFSAQCISVIPRRDQDDARERFLERAAMLEHDAQRISAMPSHFRTDADVEGSESPMNAARF
jgi:hypothetical protein